MGLSFVTHQESGFAQLPNLRRLEFRGLIMYGPSVYIKLIMYGPSVYIKLMCTALPFTSN